MSADLAELAERLSIERLLQDWGLWRDTGRWDRLRATYAPGATMKTTWFSGAAGEFVDASMRAAARPAVVLHVMGPSHVEIQRDRALAETRVTLLVRDLLDGTSVDVTCHGRFIDRLIKLGDRWAILSREPIYEKDFIMPTRAGTPIHFDEAVLQALPAGYRHLAYLQSRGGARIQLDIPAHNSPEQERLYQQGQAWLEGAVVQPSREEKS